MTAESSIDEDLLQQTRHRIRQLSREISHLADGEHSPAEFYPAFLERVLEAMAAPGGAVWLPTGDGQLELIAERNLDEVLSSNDGAEYRIRHQKLLIAAFSQADGGVVPPHAAVGERGEASNPTSCLLVLMPVRDDNRSVALVEIFQRPDAPPEAQHGYLTFLRQMCELAARWAKFGRLRGVDETQQFWSRLDQFTCAVHETLDLPRTAYTIANEARRLVQCDRVSVALPKGAKYRVEAISGQDVFDRRSKVVTLLGELASRVVAADEPLWYQGNTQDLPPQIESVLEDYVEHAHSRRISVLPLQHDRTPRHSSEDEDHPRSGDAPAHGEVVGALIFEQISSTSPPQDWRLRIDAALPHAARALGNASSHERLFLLPLWRSLGRAQFLFQRKTLPKTLAVAGGVLLLLLALLLVPIKFSLTARGELQPVDRADVFAAAEGIVRDIHVDHGDSVGKGDLLLILDNTELSVQLEDIRGRRDSTERQLLAIQRALLERRGLVGLERDEYASQLLQLKRTYESLQRQHDLLSQKAEQLRVTSPLDGQVVTWKVKENLKGRTVRPGQLLLTLASPDSEWELDVHMPEDNMGYVVDAQRNQEQPLRVTYMLATEPGTSRRGEVHEVHLAAELNEEEGHSVRLRVDIDEADLRAPRSGALVNAKVDCGRRSIAFVWLHDIIEFIQSRVLFTLF